MFKLGQPALAIGDTVALRRRGLHPQVGTSRTDLHEPPPKSVRALRAVVVFSLLPALSLAVLRTLVPLEGGLQAVLLGELLPQYKLLLVQGLLCFGMALDVLGLHTVQVLVILAELVVQAEVEVGQIFQFGPPFRLRLLHRILSCLQRGLSLLGALRNGTELMGRGQHAELGRPDGHAQPGFFLGNMVVRHKVLLSSFSSTPRSSVP